MWRRRWRWRRGWRARRADALALHKRLICLDTHLDMPANLARPGWDMMKRHSVDEDFTQVDYPAHGGRRAEGRLLRHLHARKRR